MGTELTDRLAREPVPPEQGMRLIWDTEIKGLALRVTRAGAKAWTLTYRAAGVQRSMTIGSYPDWNVRQAREEAKRLKREVDMGGDPMRDRHQDRAAPTMNDLAEHYTKVHLPRKRPGSQANDRQLLARHILPRLGNRKLEAISHRDIAALHRKVTEHGPIGANRCIALLSTMFELAFREEWISTNPARKISRNPENRRERYLTPAEISRLVEALKVHHERTSADAIMLLLLTGARRGEVLSAEWSEFDLSDDAGTWTKPSAHTKQKKAHRIPLSAPALELLRKVKADQEAGVVAAQRRGIIRPMARYVFPSDVGGKPIREVKRLWASICRSANIENCRLHDLRHTFASILVSSGLSLPIIGQMLGHTQSQTTMRYAHLSDDPLRAAAALAGDYIAAARDPKVVVPIKRNRLK